MIKSLYLFGLIFFFINGYSQGNEPIDYGNGYIGDIASYNEYKPYITNSLIPFAYNILHKDKLKFKAVELKFDADKDSVQIAYAEGDKLQLFWDAEHNIRQLTLNSKPYNVIDLFKQYTGYNEPYPVTLFAVKKLELNNRNYVLLQTGYYCNINAINQLSFTFVLQIGKDYVQIVPFKSSAYSSFLCYGDFDSDGNLDYLDLEACELTLYSYKDDKVSINKKYHLKLHCQQVNNDVELIFIKLNQSAWSFDLKTACDRFKK
jgi:hypothetical protein